MINDKLSTAIVLIIFRRPSQTERVFRVIAEAKPSRLYIIADGPRNPDEALLCQQTRQIVENVGWDCDVRRNYSDINLGLRNRVVSGLDWVFEQEDSAIILEDDCLPHLTFFRYCEELLEHYKEDSQVMHISGDNFFQGEAMFAKSYYFSKYAHVWGWATWRRAWLLYHNWDNNFSGLELDFEIFSTQSERNFWRDLLEQLRSCSMEYTWDYQWALICMAHKALCIMPAYNLVTNIGFGLDATHTRDNTWYANLPVLPMNFPLSHPDQKLWDSRADRFSSVSFFNGTTGSLFGFIKTNLLQMFVNVKKGK